jgi:predicted transcriptional regulator
MARKEADAVILLSVKPQFACAIMDGTKRVEFRRVRFLRKARAVVVYATAPVGRVLGWFEPAFIEDGSPDAMWKKHAQVGGITLGEYRKYYQGAKRAVVLGVGKVHRFGSGLELGDLGPAELRPPQSFRYLNTARFPDQHAWGQRKPQADPHG